MAESLLCSKDLSKDLIPTSSLIFKPNTAVAHTSTIVANEVEAKKIALGSINVRASCLDIKEPESNDDEQELRKGMEAYMTDVLAKYTRTWTERTKHNLGYQLNLEYEFDNLIELLKYSLNNVGDPFVEGNYGIHSRDFEIGVLDWFARLWEIHKDDYWGYITNGGTEGNLHGLLVGRDIFPDGILYTSKESHCSVFKAAYMYRMECNIIETMVSGEIDCRDLKFRLLQNKDKPVIMNINIGTTMKGAIDDLDLVVQTLEECGFQRNRFYIHCDGALFGVMLPFVNQVPQITFKKPIDSVSVSGHKFVGCPLPCGIQIVRLKHIDGALSKNVEYLATRDATITCSRNGHTSIFLWYTLSRKGYNGFRKEVQKCLHNAHYLKARLKKAGVSVMLNELSNMVVFERPQDDGFVRHWQLACQGNIAHVTVMPNVTIEMLDCFVDELVAKRSIWFGDEGKQPPCVASQIGKENCACPLHK